MLFLAHIVHMLMYMCDAREELVVPLKYFLGFLDSSVMRKWLCQHFYIS